MTWQLMDLATAYGVTIERVRVERGWSKIELAKRASTRRQIVRRIESGLHEPKLEQVLRMAEALGVDPVELLAEVIRVARERAQP